MEKNLAVSTHIAMYTPQRQIRCKLWLCDRSTTYWTNTLSAILRK
uniref:Uncharacterized protein n=1 Tax=Megaselia scalaris TaxID=36166 RepID=T1GL38_MEGSC